ncbi:MAG TPA: hypothetical protein VK629_05340 [Steroidobacteraceae bacterium]|nr:hypothetical protein [Steroidobacteraceae bacterium]
MPRGDEPVAGIDAVDPIVKRSLEAALKEWKNSWPTPVGAALFVIDPMTGGAVYASNVPRDHTIAMMKAWLTSQEKLA